MKYVFVCLIFVWRIISISSIIYDKLSECLNSECSDPQRTMRDLSCSFRQYDYADNHKECLNQVNFLLLAAFNDSSSYDINPLIKQLHRVTIVYIKTNATIACDTISEINSLQTVYIDKGHLRHMKACLKHTNCTVKEFEKVDYDALDSQAFFRLDNVWLYVIGSIVLILMIIN